MAKGKSKSAPVGPRKQKDIRSYLLPKKPQTDIRSFLVPKNPPKKVAACVKNKVEIESKEAAAQILRPTPRTLQAQLLMRLPLGRLEMHYKYLSKSDSWPSFLWVHILVYVHGLDV